jgi:hypothetical protein
LNQTARPVATTCRGWFTAGTHLPENLSDSAFEVIVIELKGKAPKPAKPAAEKKK